jgi:hypothetical protein
VPWGAPWGVRFVLRRGWISAGTFDGRYVKGRQESDLKVGVWDQLRHLDPQLWDPVPEHKAFLVQRWPYPNAQPPPLGQGLPVPSQKQVQENHTPETDVGPFPLLSGVTLHGNMGPLPPHTQCLWYPITSTPVPFKVTNIKKERRQEGRPEHPLGWAAPVGRWG